MSDKNNKHITTIPFTIWGRGKLAAYPALLVPRYKIFVMQEGKQTHKSEIETKWWDEKRRGREGKKEENGKSSVKIYLFKHMKQVNL